MQIYLTHAGLLRKRRFGNAPLLKQRIQQFMGAAAAEAVLIFGQEPIQVGGIHQLLLQTVCVFHGFSAFTSMLFFYIIIPFSTNKINMHPAYLGEG